jgi:hypothetical protein
MRRSGVRRMISIKGNKMIGKNKYRELKKPTIINIGKINKYDSITFLNTWKAEDNLVMEQISKQLQKRYFIN